MAGHHAVWEEPLLSALERDFDVVALDQRGVGESDAGTGEFTVADLADDVAGVMAALGWDRACVVGHSLGGMVAQELALRHPERVRALVLASTYPGGDGTDLSAPGPMAMLTAMQSGNREAMLRATFEANVSPAYAADHAHFDAFTTMALSVPIRAQTIAAQAKAAFLHNAADRLGGITAPTLVLHARDDQMILYRNGELLASLIPHARLHTFDDGGHLFWFARPDETAQLIREHC
jgi:pimeloyl-ACP methyl ester carboxylesterase